MLTNTRSSGKQTSAINNQMIIHEENKQKPSNGFIENYFESTGNKK